MSKVKQFLLEVRYKLPKTRDYGVNTCDEREIYRLKEEELRSEYNL